MKIRLNMNKQLLIMLLFGILLLCSPTRVSASIVWEEDFESGDLDDWEFFGAEGHITFGEPFDPNFTIVDGALVVPHIPDWSNVTIAFHNSTVATGTWSFDLFFPPDLKYAFAITFMFSSSDGDYFPTVGMDEDEYLTKMTGYGLIFRGDIKQIYLVSYSACPASELNVSEAKLFSSPLSGYHHFDITRNTTGQFYVYHNYDYNSPIISYQCSFTSSSEKFGITSFIGSTWLDNITVSDTVDIPEPDGSTTTTTTTTENGTPGFSNLLLLSSSITLVYLYRRRKKRSI
ncbi:MAG: hypothetical protein ACFFAJ_12655 [Candidatus Hodarchaeota archaeon]